MTRCSQRPQAQRGNNSGWELRALRCSARRSQWWKKQGGGLWWGCWWLRFSIRRIGLLLLSAAGVLLLPVHRKVTRTVRAAGARGWQSCVTLRAAQTRVSCRASQQLYHVRGHPPESPTRYSVVDTPRCAHRWGGGGGAPRPRRPGWWSASKVAAAAGRRHVKPPWAACPSRADIADTITHQTHSLAHALPLAACLRVCSRQARLLTQRQQPAPSDHAAAPPCVGQQNTPPSS